MNTHYGVYLKKTSVYRTVITSNKKQLTFIIFYRIKLREWVKIIGKIFEKYYWSDIFYSSNALYFLGILYQKERITLRFVSSSPSDLEWNIQYNFSLSFLYSLYKLIASFYNLKEKLLGDLKHTLRIKYCMNVQ